MSCSCQTQQVLPTSPDGECLPTLDQACGLAKSTELCAPCAADSDCLNQDKSDGTTLPNQWLDSCCVNKDVTLLARVGNKLVRFTQSGFLKLVNGKATVVESIAFRVVTLWHRYWSPGPGAAPVLGDPLPFNYLTVLDQNGNPHAIQGRQTEDSILKWNATTKQFEQISYDEFVASAFPDASTVPDFAAQFNNALTN